jgi:hypothetical protein
MSNKKSPAGLMCEQCGVEFTTQQEKEEHMKLEHEEGPVMYRF